MISTSEQQIKRQHTLDSTSPGLRKDRLHNTIVGFSWILFSSTQLQCKEWLPKTDTSELCWKAAPSPFTEKARRDLKADSAGMSEHCVPSLLCGKLSTRELPVTPPHQRLTTQKGGFGFQNEWLCPTATEIPSSQKCHFLWDICHKAQKWGASFQ